MTDTLTRESVDLSAQFALEIPCGGCVKAAELRTFGHSGCSVPMPLFSCTACHVKWLQVMAEKLAALGAVRCSHCLQFFFDVDSFAEWRPF